MIGDRCLRVAHHAFILFLVVATVAVLSAQTVVDPRFVEFSPSVDHNTNASDGTPLVQRYSLSVYVVGSSVAVGTRDLGKPTPSGGVIRVDLVPLNIVLTPGVVYEARVTAIGPGGSTASSLSNGFSFQPACAPSLNSTGQSVGAGGATGSVDVTAGAGCTWSAVSNNTGWLTVTSGASGNGNGTVGFSTTANPNGTPRNGSITIAGQTFSVTQAAAPCSHTLTPTSHSMAMGGGTGSTDVTAPAGCAWTAVSSNTGWLTVTGGASGNGDGTVGFRTTANPNGTPRNGSITIAGQTVSVTQAAAPCSYSLAPAALSVASTGETGSTAVAAPNGCDWTAVSNTGWLTVTGGASGSGDGSVSFSASANASSNERTGTLTVGGETFSITQAGAPCTYSISPVSRSIAAGGTTGSTDVTAPAGCTWSAVSNNTGWLMVTSGANDSGNGSVGFSASANTSPSQRSGTLTVAGKTFTVTQAGAGCTFAISSNSVAVVAAGGTGSTNVTAGVGCPWSAASNASWITMTSGASDSGNGSVGFSVAANPGTSARTGTLTIATWTFTVSQAAAACGYSLTPTSRAVGSGGANTTTNVTTAPGCAWTAVSNTTAWLAITDGASGSGNGTVSFSANTNTTTQVRVGTATIAGQTFTVTQNAASCAFTVSPTTMEAPFAGANGSSTVTTPDGCAWTATSNTPWITVTSGAQGTTSGQVNFTVAPSTATSQRLGSLTIAGRTFAVTQAGNTCSYMLTPASRTIGGEGGTGSITVATASGCPWTATTSQSWISVSGTGTASGSASYTVSANTTGTSRAGSISIGTKSFTITQGVSTGSTPVAPSGLRVVVTGSE